MKSTSSGPLSRFRLTREQFCAEAEALIASAHRNGIHQWQWNTRDGVRTMHACTCVCMYVLH